MTNEPMNPEMYATAKRLLTESCVRFIQIAHADSFLVAEAIIDRMGIGQLQDLSKIVVQRLGRQRSALAQERRRFERDRIKKPEVSNVHRQQ